MIKAIIIKDFFSFKGENEINLNPGVNLLLGINGSGKTSFINALRILDEGIAGDGLVKLIQERWGGFDQIVNFNGEGDASSAELQHQPLAGHFSTPEVTATPQLLHIHGRKRSALSDFFRNFAVRKKLVYMKVVKFLKDWTLIISIFAGIIGYFVYVSIPFLEPTKEFANQAVSVIQPMLIFAMLFLTFSKINPRKLRFRMWHLWLLAIQCGLFLAIGCVLIALPHSGLRVVLEGAMICLICPTATAGAVITKKLGGNVNNITTYTILINLATALLIPALVPFVHPNPSMNVWTSAVLILGKVFPLLLLPLVSAVIIRYLFPKLNRKISQYQELSFYLWAVALALAMAVTTRSIVHSTVSLTTQLWLVAVSLVCCGMQFWLGRKIGAHYNDTITAGQSFGQKNTVLAIWMGYTFFTPITSIVGGFYSIWHNLVNSWQLYDHKRKTERADEL